MEQFEATAIIEKLNAEIVPKGYRLLSMYGDDSILDEVRLCTKNSVIEVFMPNDFGRIEQSVRENCA